MEKYQRSVKHFNREFCFLLYHIFSAWEPGLFLEDAEFEVCFSLVNVNNATNQDKCPQPPMGISCDLILDKATELNFYESGKTAEFGFLLLPSSQTGQEFEAGPRLVLSERQQQGVPVSSPLCTKHQQ